MRAADDAEAYKIEIKQARLLANYLTLNEEMESTLKAKLSIGPLTYPYLASDLINVHTIAQGVKETVLTISQGPVGSFITTLQSVMSFLAFRYQI